MQIAIGSDHAGITYKAVIVQLLNELGHTVRDFGPQTDEAVDYPDTIRPVAEAVASGEYERGIILGGSGNGEQMVANKVRGIRCALCWNTTTARLARQHNNANMVSIGERVTGVEEVRDLVRVFLDTEFEGGRHQRRIDKIES